MIKSLIWDRPSRRDAKRQISSSLRYLSIKSQEGVDYTIFIMAKGGS